MDINETQIYIFLKSVNMSVHSMKELMKYIDEIKITSRTLKNKKVSRSTPEIRMQLMSSKLD